VSPLIATGNSALVIGMHLPERFGCKFQSVNQSLAFCVTTEYQLNGAVTLCAAHFCAASVGKNDHSTASFPRVTTFWAVCSNRHAQDVATIELRRNGLDSVTIDFRSTVLQVVPPLLGKPSA
jgi:hypothetical protein